MKKLLLLLAFCLLSLSTNSQSVYFPPSGGEAWKTLSPDSLNWCPTQIEGLYDYLERIDTKAFLILKDGKIVLERYFGNYTADSLWFWFSAGKSLRACLVGIAQEEGALNIQDKTSDYLGVGWTNLSIAQEDSIRIWHQLTMTTGLNEAFFDCIDPDCLRYVAQAGERWAYHNGPYNLLKEVLESATGETINAYTNSRIKGKIGMESGFWLSSGNNTFFVSRARDMARFGVLLASGGSWEGESVIGDSVYFQQMIHPSQELNPSYGYLWWLNGQESYIPPNISQPVAGPFSPAAPSDVFTAAGSNGQFISISPSEGLIMVRQGLTVAEDLAATGLHDAIWERIMHLECTVTSQEEAVNATILIYPNPVCDMVQVEGIKQEEVGSQIELLNAQGQVVRRYASPGSLSVQGLPSGNYWLRIVQSSGSIVRPILIK